MNPPNNNVSNVPNVPHLPKIPNNTPIEARAVLPPHRACNCPNNWLIGLSHTSLINALVVILDGDFKPISGSWLPEVVNELLYRGVLISDKPYVYAGQMIPLSRTGFVAEYPFREEFAFPTNDPGVEEAHGKQKKG